MEPEFVKFLATMGTGGIIAGLVFFFYRKDSLDHAKTWQGQSEMLLQVVKENTASNTSLQATTAALNGVILGLQRDMAAREVWWRDHFPKS
jgi:hypothetical protein